MRVLLVHPAMGRRSGGRYLRTWQMQPLWPAVLSSVTPSDIDLTFADDRVEDVPYDDDWDLVGVNVETYTARRAYQIASEFRRRGVPVVAGGFHATLVPDEVGRYAEAVVVGEGEAVWADVLADAAAGRLQRGYQGVRADTLTGAAPDRSVFAGKRYLPLHLVETGRGCPFDCEFCAVQRFYDSTYRRRPIEDVISEIQAHRMKRVFFVDDNVIGDGGPSAREFLDAITPLGIKWFSQASVNCAADPELLRRMRQSGCVGLLVGLESLDDDNLERMGKGVNRSGQSPDAAIAALHEHDIRIYATFLLGYEGDDLDTPARLEAFAQRHRLFMCAFNHVTPFPGTPLYERLEREGRLLFDSWWLDPAYGYNSLPFQPAAAPAQELERAAQELRSRFYDLRSIVRRGMAPWNRRMVREYLAANLGLRRDIQVRHRFPLGDDADAAPLLEVGA